MLKVEETTEREIVRLLAIGGVRPRVKVRQQGRLEVMMRRKISARPEDCRPGDCGGLSSPSSSRRQKEPGCCKKPEQITFFCERVSFGF